ALSVAKMSSSASPRVQYELDVAMAWRLYDSGLLTHGLKKWLYTYVRLIEMDPSSYADYGPNEEKEIMEASRYTDPLPLTLPPATWFSVMPVGHIPEKGRCRTTYTRNPRPRRSRSVGDSPAPRQAPLPTQIAAPEPQQKVEDQLPQEEAPAAHEQIEPPTALPTHTESVSYAQAAKIFAPTHIEAENYSPTAAPPAAESTAQPASRSTPTLPRVRKHPPIVHLRAIQEKLGQAPSVRPFGTGVRFTPQDDDEGRIVRAHLSEQTGLKDRSLKVAIRGLPVDTRHEDIAEALAEKGFELEHSKQIRARAGRPGSLGNQALALDKLTDHEMIIASQLVVPDEINVSWKDIAGLDNLIQELRETVILPIQKRDLFADSRLTQPPKGVLLHGPPGKSEIKPINVPTAGAQAFPMDGIRRLGHDPPRGPSADWRVLTTADAAGTNSITCLPKHGGAQDSIFFWSPIQ
ncbi:hypothetical protein evm_014903, partial [Chilo suppressalis]